jgi:hypothetical protein
MNNPIPAYKQLGYIDDCIEQTMLWVNGKPEHRNNECTIDFSCCQPDLLSSYERRLESGTKKLDELHKRRLVALSRDS